MVSYGTSCCHQKGEGAFCRRYTQARQTAGGVVYGDGKSATPGQMVNEDVARKLRAMVAGKGDVVQLTSLLTTLQTPRHGIRLEVGLLSVCEH